MNHSGKNRPKNKNREKIAKQKKNKKQKKQQKTAQKADVSDLLLDGGASTDVSRDGFGRSPRESTRAYSVVLDSI
jgi:hypothetical protein